MDSFAEKYGPWAVVTGASYGIGAEFARRMASLKLNVVLVARRAEPMAKLSKELEDEFKVQTKVIIADLASDSGVEKTLSETADVDVGLLVNNAGVAFHGNFLYTDVSKHASMISLNVTAVTKLAHGFGRRLVRKGSGGIIFVSSITKDGMPWAASYAASKAYVAILAYSMKFELQDSGVDVLSLEPGAIETRMSKEGDFLTWAGPANTTDVCVSAAVDGLSKGLLRVTPGVENNAAADEAIMKSMSAVSGLMKAKWDSKIFEPLPKGSAQ